MTGVGAALGPLWPERDRLWLNELNELSDGTNPRVWEARVLDAIGWSETKAVSMKQS